MEQIWTVVERFIESHEGDELDYARLYFMRFGGCFDGEAERMELRVKLVRERGEERVREIERQIYI